MNAHYNCFVSGQDRLRHFERTRHVRFVEDGDGMSYCQECEEISIGAIAPGMEDDDATRTPAPGMVSDTV
jgi:hypothetical protein